tara:strand:- start:1277 stop:2161 length:885 start_codon:yes stop_codon:yes gene_type:complete
MDNQDTQTQENVQTQDTDASGEYTVATGEATSDNFTWKEKLGVDLMNSPTLQKFEDNKEGLTKAVSSHLELEKLLGHEKVPIPKGDNDTDGWARFNKAMGVPDISTQYDLKDVEIPDAMKEIAFDKDKFAEVVHAFKLTPRQAQGLWGAYTEMNMKSYSDFQKQGQEALTKTVNELRGDWGDAYDSNIELGQMVINKFAANQDMNNWLTETLAGHPFGAKFLAGIGKQFSENKIGEFKYQQFSMSPDEAQSEINKVSNDPNHPYNNEKSNVQERNAAIDYVNSLYGIINKGKQG